MDFIPLPRNSTRPHIEIPFLAKQSFPYHNGKLDSEPQLLEQYAVDVGLIQDGQYSLDSFSPDQLAGLLQTWLFFGVISCFFHTQISLEDFRRNRDDGAEVVTTSKFEELFAAKNPRFFLPGPRDRYRLSVYAWQQVMKLEEEALMGEGQFPILLLSIKLLLISTDLLHGIKGKLAVAFVEDRYSVAFREGVDISLKPLDVLSEKASPSADALLSLMHSVGICTVKARQMCTKWDFLTLYYLCFTVDESQSRHRHELCHGEYCVANNVLDDAYETLHVDPSCDCRLLQVPLEQVKKVVENGQVPVIRLTSELSIEVKAVEQQTEYVTLSHVWSQGLGNPIANALPSCQLLRIQELVDASPKPFALAPALHRSLPSWRRLSSANTKSQDHYFFWIDTMCVPVGDENKHLRKLAISQMYAIYSRATHAQVLDNVLAKTISTKELSIGQIMGHLQLSDWASRCWTFQEAVLAPIVKIQLLDGVVNPAQEFLPPWELRKDSLSAREIFLTLIKGWKLVFRHEVFYDPMRMFGPVGLHIWHFVMKKLKLDSLHSQLTICVERRLRADMRDQLLQDLKSGESGLGLVDIFFVLKARLGTENYFSYNILADVWSTLATRSTSREEDRITILATCLGFRPSALLDIPLPEDKLHCIFLTLASIPVSFLYNTGPRLNPSQNHQRRWLPTTLRDLSLHTYPGEDWLTIYKQGLALNVTSSDETQKRHVAVELDWTCDKQCLEFVLRFLERGKTAETHLAVKLCKTAQDELWPLAGSTSSFLLLEYDFEKGNTKAMSLSGRGALIYRAFHDEKSIALTSERQKQGMDSDATSEPVTETPDEVIYDCPVRIQHGVCPEKSMLPLLSGKLHTSFRFRFPAEAPDVPILAKQPPRLESVFHYAHGGLHWFVSVMFSYVAMGLMIAMLCKAPFRDLGPVAKGSGIAFCVLSFVELPFVVFLSSLRPSTIPAICFLAAQGLLHENIRRLEIAFVVFFFGLEPLLKLELFLVTHYIINPVTRAWNTDTLDADWSLERDESLIGYALRYVVHESRGEDAVIEVVKMSVHVAAEIVRRGWRGELRMKGRRQAADC